MATSTPDLTERQKDVLELAKAGKNPTEIGRSLGISSQGVHGHLRRLRNKNLLPPLDGGSQAKPATFDPNSALDAVRKTIAEQKAGIDARREQIDAEIRDLQNERKRLDRTLKELEALAGAQLPASK